MIQEKLTIALRQKVGRGCAEPPPVLAEPVIVEHVPPQCRRSGARAKFRYGGLMGRVGIGEGVYLAVQPDPPRRSGQPDPSAAGPDEVPSRLPVRELPVWAARWRWARKFMDGAACLGVNVGDPSLTNRGRIDHGQDVSSPSPLAGQI